MDKKIISSAKLTVAGPYSQAVEANGFVFISGQLPLNPATGEVIHDIKPATAQALNNLQDILRARGLELDHIIKTTIYIQDMTNYSAVNEIYAGFFPSHPPARSMVGVASLPKNAPLEIEAIAIIK